MIRLSKEQHEYIIQKIDKDLKQQLEKNIVLINNNYEYRIDDELEIDFYDFLQDKQVEIGYDKSYNPNSDWEELQKIIDEVYNQMN